MHQPDIIFIVLDTQRADRLGAYGYHRDLSPNFDAFAADSIKFMQAVSTAQWTVPSHASMFTGLYPTAHQLVQSNQSLGSEHPHLAETLRRNGYQTVGFCNNPLVGILNNGLKRGFHTFYNYGGAIPTVPKSSSKFPWPLDRLSETYTQFLRRISYPIQNFFGQSDLAFSISLHAWLTPLWSRLANFKGQNERSVTDVRHFLEARRKQANPLFLFLNLMETHLPFTPPRRYVDKWAPAMKTREGQRLMRNWNRESYRWGAPLAEPLDPLEDELLNDMYDAEVAYQDDYLGPLLETLAARENTLTILVSDHGDGLGEHGYMGHAFVAYQELIHVPLILRWPERWPKALTLDTPVSTRRLFHTVLDAAGIKKPAPGLDLNEVRDLSLKHTIFGQDPEGGTAYAEVYPPANFIRAVSDRYPELIDRHGCRSMRRAVVQDAWKLIRVDEKPAELYQLAADPREVDNRLAAEPETTSRLDRSMALMKHRLELQRNQLPSGEALDLSTDEKLLQHLKGLGYIE